MMSDGLISPLGWDSASVIYIMRYCDMQQSHIHLTRNDFYGESKKNSGGGNILEMFSIPTRITLQWICTNIYN